MMKGIFGSRLRGFALAGTVAAALGGGVPATALAALPPMPATGTGVLSTDSSSCTNPLLSQPFLSAGDSSYYTLLPGETHGNVDGAGWTLGGKASLVSTTTAGGAAGTVLNLPSGGYAITPSICVTSLYPTARTEVRDLVGAEGVQMYVSYEGTSTWMNPRNTGQFHGNGTAWTLSTPVNLQPAGVAGWQIVRFLFVAGGTTSDFQMYDFWVDPRMK